MSEREHAFEGEPTEGDVRGAGVRIHYLDWGGSTPSAPAILFLHGGGLNAHTWDVVCDLLHREFRCVALDLRGHGDSEWHPEADYSLGSHVEDVSAAVAALKLSEFVLVGMSLGGAVALRFAATWHRELDGLVLVDTGPVGSRAAGRRRLGAFMEGPQEFGSIDEIIDRAIAFNPRRSRDRLRRTLANNLRQTERGTWTWKYDDRFRRPFSDPSVSDEERARRFEERNRTLWAAAAMVTCPTLVVRGGDSDMFLDEDAERTAAAFARGRWTRVAGASHTVQSDKPYELADTLREFIANDVLGAT